MQLGLEVAFQTQSPRTIWGIWKALSTFVIASGSGRNDILQLSLTNRKSLLCSVSFESLPVTRCVVGGSRSNRASKTRSVWAQSSPHLTRTLIVRQVPVNNQTLLPLDLRPQDSSTNFDWFVNISHKHHLNMRRKTVLLAALPFTHALSLGNFQDITSVLIPVNCLLTYDQQIPSCVVADFGEKGCSTGCQASLTSLASNVVKACSTVTVSSNTLLGIIKGGGILPALCTSLQKPTTSKAKTSTAPAPVQQPSEVVTLPTTSPGVQVPTSSTKKTTPTAQTVVPTSKTETKSSSSNTVEPATETSVEPTAEPTAEPTPSTIALATDSNTAGIVTSTTQPSTSSTSASKSSSATSKSNTGGVSGGGSPFDIQASTTNGAQALGMSMLAIMVALGTGILVGR